MSAQQFTVEEIEREAEALTHVESAAAYSHTRLMLRAFALQTRQVEQMREWLEKKAAVSMSTGNDTVNLLLASSETAMYGALQEFSCLFPKNGGQ